MQPLSTPKGAVRFFYRKKNLGKAQDFVSSLASAPRVRRKDEAALRALYDIHRLGIDWRHFQGENLSATRHLFQALSNPDIAAALYAQSKRMGTIGQTEVIEIKKPSENKSVKLYFNELEQLCVDVGVGELKNTLSTQILGEFEGKRIPLEEGFLIDYGEEEFIVFLDLLKILNMLPQLGPGEISTFQNELFGAVFFNYLEKSFRLVDGYSISIMYLDENNNIETVTCNEREGEVELEEQARPRFCFHVHPQTQRQLLLTVDDCSCVILGGPIYGTKRGVLAEAIIDEDSGAIKFCVPRRLVSFSPCDRIEGKIHMAYKSSSRHFPLADIQYADWHEFITNNGIINFVAKRRDPDLPSLFAAANDDPNIYPAEMGFVPWFMFLSFEYTPQGYQAIVSS